MYQIQIRLKSSTTEKEQEMIFSRNREFDRHHSADTKANDSFVRS